MNPTPTLRRSVVLPLGFVTAMVLLAVLLSIAASLALIARKDPAPAPLPVLAPVSPAPAADTGVPDAATALRGALEPEATSVPGF